ncbi:phosphotransferase [Paenibacillus sp. LMG 31456]|uniref:Phosphotransferase n=1 Tax=Paenibacillus foliorum TaxID=2654974 RepID=A0A972GQY9_9BACL|nr:phosphotransferase [Paenibacillus foliorum]NOU94565.1 phosphotransferase [Paenibacillus foliorum]
MTSVVEARVTDDSEVREEVFAHLAELFSLRIYSYIPNFLGLYNMKWIVTTNAGELFVKCYHPKRYQLTDTDRRAKIGRSLSFQQQLHDQASLCPGVWSQDGEYIFQSPSGHFYVVMQRVAGHPLQAGLVDTETMHKLGKATGRMHVLLSSFPAEGVIWVPSMTTMIDKWRSNLEKVMDLAIPNEKAIRAIKKQGMLLSCLDLSIFSELEPGWAHWDLWVDNMLIEEDSEVHFVDFDTIQFGYPEIDIARVLLSCALHMGELRIEPASAFLAGYREERPFPRGRLPLALKLLWCREAHWWLKPGMDDFSAPPKRFAEEMIWLTDNWHDLEELYAGW